LKQPATGGKKSEAVTDKRPRPAGAEASVLVPQPCRKQRRVAATQTEEPEQRVTLKPGPPRSPPPRSPPPWRRPRPPPSPPRASAASSSGTWQQSRADRWWHETGHNTSCQEAFADGWPDDSALLEEAMDRLMEDDTFGSENVLVHACGLKDVAARNLAKQKRLLEHPERQTRFHELIQAMPPGNPPATGGDRDFKTVKELCNARRGELSEWHGKWMKQQGPPPSQGEQAGLWQQQFFPPHASEVTCVSTVVSVPRSEWLAAGNQGLAAGNQEALAQVKHHYVRVAVVFGLADLFYDLGSRFSAADLYHVFQRGRVFARPRERTIQAWNVEANRNRRWQY